MGYRRSMDRDWRVSTDQGRLRIVRWTSVTRAERASALTPPFEHLHSSDRCTLIELLREFGQPSRLDFSRVSNDELLQEFRRELDSGRLLALRVEPRSAWSSGASWKPTPAELEPALQNAARAQEPAKNDQEKTTPAKEKTCHHPVKCTCTLDAKGLDFGLKVHVTWESPTGDLADLSTCHVTERITYSAIRNPPFGPPSGTQLAESGRTQRIPAGTGVAATDGRGQDIHRHPRGLVRSPPSADHYTVDQTYDFNCTACESGWVPFATYRVTYSISADKSGVWTFETRKTGPGGPHISQERI